MCKVSFVIPCYRSEQTIEAVYQEICTSMQKMKISSFEVILVNDCSPDGTLQTLKKLASEHDNITVISFARNFGQHAALMAGFRYCHGETVVCLDDDGQTPADEVDKLLNKLDEGYDVVYASYEHKQHSKFRNFGSWVNTRMTEILLGKPRELKITSYFAARRFIIEEIINYKYCYPYVLGLVLRSSSKIANVPVHHRNRMVGTSGYSFKKLLSLWLNGFTAFSVKPLRFASYFGSATALLGFLYALYIFLKYFIYHTAPLGWSSLMAALLIISGVMLMVLGLIGEYVGRIYLSITASPQYVIKEVIKGDSHA